MPPKVAEIVLEKAPDPVPFGAFVNVSLPSTCVILVRFPDSTRLMVPRSMP